MKKKKFVTFFRELGEALMMKADADHKEHGIGRKEADSARITASVLLMNCAKWIESDEIRDFDVDKLLSDVYEMVSFGLKWNRDHMLDEVGLIAIRDKLLKAIEAAEQADES